MVFKTYFSVVTLAIGFQGGEVTPLFSIRATLGFILAPIFQLPIGHQMIAFLIICIFAYLVNVNKSIYTAQIKNF